MNEETVRADRVRKISPNEANERIDRDIEISARRHAVATDETIEQRLRDLSHEWDMERVLETNAATLGLGGVLLSAFVDRRWLWLPGIVTAFLLQHGVQGWCPPVVLFRRLGIRTRKEIDTEKYALKALRGDFGEVNAELEPGLRAKQALQGVRK